MIVRDTLKAMLLRLREPWWTPLPPHEYVMRHPNDGKPAGVGLIVGGQYGEWNLAVALMGASGVPRSLEDHGNWVAAFVTASKRLGAIEVEGQPLAGYAALMPPDVFRQWLRAKETPALAKADRQALLDGLDHLLGSPVT